MNKTPQRRAEDKLNSNPRSIPENQDEMLFQVWFALIGTNGSGLLEQFKELKVHVEEKLVTKEACSAYQVKKEKKYRNIERVFYVAFAVLGFLFGDNIVMAVKAAFGG